MNLIKLEDVLEQKISKIASVEDPAHDLLHFKRVVKIAKSICKLEQGNFEIVVPAAWLHDFIIIPKNDPRRSLASKLSAEAAVIYLKQLNYPEIYLADIAHAIESHSFSANIQPRTIEAKIVQDADRLDGLGAIGIARCFATAGLLKRPFYSELDPFCDARDFDDKQFTIDHFYSKLFKVAETLQTDAGRHEGRIRVQVMQKYLADLKLEINDSN
ncbi:MAG: HD domain-containing protein [Pseudobdellovibrio sp.]